MRDWLSASDLASLGLPGLPATKRGWNEYAERAGWLSRKDEHGHPLARVTKGAGGSRVEYHIDLLPPVSLAGYVARHVGKVDIGRAEAVAASLAQQPATISALEQRDARLSLIAAADRLAQTSGLTRHVADRLFAGLYQMGQIEVAPWVRAAVKEFSARSLTRWRTHKARGELNKLGVDKGAARRGKGKIAFGEEGKVEAFLLAEIGRNAKVTCVTLHRLIAAEFPQLAVSIDTVERAVKRLKEKNKVPLAALSNPDHFKSAYRVAGTNVAVHVYRINQLWEIDASPADALTTDGRYSIYCCIDVFSRRMIILVTKTPRAEAVGLLVRKAIHEWGVPEIIKTDNGSDFRARFTQHLFNALEIEIEVCPPYQPQKKPHVERAIQTFQHDFCRNLPGFVGHSVADRKVIEERRAFSARLGLDDAGAFCVELSADDLQRRADAWAAQDYGTRPHSSLGMSPFEKAAAFDGVVRRLDDPAALNVLLAPIAKGDGTRVVTKRGVQVDGRYYLTHELPETKVFVRRDPQDLGRLWLFSEDGLTFLGEAICHEIAGIDPAAAVAEMRAHQKRLIDEALAPVRKEMRKRSQIDIADILARQAAERAGKLVAFPHREAGYTTPALQAASEAAGSAAAPEAPSPALPIPVQTTAPGAHVVVLPESKQQRFRRALDFEGREARGEPLSNEEMRWLVSYQIGAEYAAMKAMFEDFGEAALK